MLYLDRITRSMSDKQIITPESAIAVLKKEGLKLSGHYEKYLVAKKRLINHDKMVEYIFNKSMMKIDGPRDLITSHKMMKNYPIRLVRLEKGEPIQIIKYFTIINKALYTFVHTNTSCKKYLESVKKNKIVDIFHCLPLVEELSKKKQYIIKVLDTFEYTHNMIYIYEWSMAQEGVHLTVFHKPEINYGQPFVYDFYGITIDHGLLNQFVILYDDETHFDLSSKDYNNIHVNDIYKQHILFQMNIHLLRLNRKSKILDEITSFLDKIINATNYISINPITPQKKLFNKNAKKYIPDLDNFAKDYNYNHVVYSKMPVKKYTNYEPDDEIFFNDLINKKYESKLKPHDQSAHSYTVTSDVLNKILKMKQTSKKTKSDKMSETNNSDRAGEIVVKLIGIDD